MTLKTVCDLRTEAARAAQEKYRIPKMETDHRKVLADPEIDAVLIATRESEHAGLTIEALRAGKHVYVEKPLAETSEACRAIVRAQEESGRHVAVGFNRRFAPAYRKAKDIIDTHGGAWNIYYRIADWYSFMWGKDYPPGQRVFHEVCHIFDVLRFLVGSEAKSIYCAASRADDELLVLRFASGPVAAIMSSGHVTVDMPKESLEVITKRGGLTVENFVELRTYGLPDVETCYRFPGHVHPDFDFTHRWLYGELGAEAMRAICSERFWLKYAPQLGMTRPGDPIEQTLAREYAEHHAPQASYDVDKGWLHAVDHFAECIATGRTPENAGAGDGLAAQQLAEAAARSRQTGHVVDL